MQRTAVLCDLDSTLCNTQARHCFSPFSDSKYTWVDYGLACDRDVLVPGVRAVLSMARALSWEVHLVSGRCVEAEEKTLKWLADNDVPFDTLTLRGAGDGHLDNTRFKLERVRELEAEGVSVALFLEDWKHVADGLEAAGVNVLCVNPRYHDVDLYGLEPDSPRLDSATDVFPDGRSD